MADEGGREQRRRETHRRIAEVGLRLFIEHGYDGATLEMVAEAAGISRRTFFAYYKSKDEILSAWDRTTWELFLDKVRRVSPDEEPLTAVTDLLVSAMARSDDASLRAIAKLMKSSSTLIAARHASYAEREWLLYEALCEVWRQPERRATLRMTAMVLVGTLRVAVETWEAAQVRRSLAQLYRDALSALGDVVEPSRY